MRRKCISIRSGFSSGHCVRTDSAKEVKLGILSHSSRTILCKILKYYQRLPVIVSDSDVPVQFWRSPTTAARASSPVDHDDGDMSGARRTSKWIMPCQAWAGVDWPLASCQPLL